MLLHDARRDARVDDRRRPRAARRAGPHAGGTARRSTRAPTLVERAALRRRGGPARTSCRRRSPPCTTRRRASDDTDWRQIAALYGELARTVPSPIVELNRAVAVAMADGPEQGLALMDRLGTGVLESNHLFHSARADLLVRLGRPAEAVDAYREALALVATTSERRFLERRLRGLTADQAPGVS